MVTRPFASTTVFPPGSGNDPCRNQVGDTPSAGPCAAGCVCANAPVAVRITTSEATAMREKPREVISVSFCESKLGAERRQHVATVDGRGFEVHGSKWLR